MAQTHSLDLESSSSQYAGIADGSQTGLDLTNSLTIEAWVKFNSLPTGGSDMPIVYKWNTSNSQRGYRFTLSESSGNLRLNLGVSSAGTVTVDANSNNIPIKTGVWYFVSVTWNAGAYVFYLNGLAVGSGTTPVTSLHNSTEPFVVGMVESTRYLNGQIKDVRVFNDVRTAGEIATDAYTQNVSDANLQGEWNFNNSYTDTSGNGNTLTPTNSPTFSTNIPWEQANQVDGSTYLETNLRAYYNMGGNTNEPVNSYDGSDANMAYDDSYGKIEQGARLNGSSSRSDLPALGSSSEDISISAWIKTTQTSQSDPMIIGNSANNAILELKINDTTNKVSLTTWNGSTSLKLTSGKSINDGSYHHIVLVKQGSVGSVYIDGVLEITGSIHNISALNGDENAIGYHRHANDSYYNGDVDEIAIYARALHYGDVLDLYNAGSGITYTALAPTTNSNFFAFM